MNEKIIKIIKRLFCNHKYDEFVSQKMIHGGMDKLITRKCIKCGKLKQGTIGDWRCQ